MCLPVPVPRGAGGSRKGVSGGPASPYIALARVEPACPRWPIPKGRHLHVALVHLPTAKGAFRGFPPCLAMASGTMGAPVPTHQRNLLPGHAGSTGSHSHRRALFLTRLGTVFPRVPVDGAAPQSHKGSLFSRCAGEQGKSLFASSSVKRTFPIEPCYFGLCERGQVLVVPSTVFAFQCSQPSSFSVTLFSPLSLLLLSWMAF